MNKISRITKNTLATILTLSCSFAFAAGISHDQYKSQKDQIENQYDTAKKHCDDTLSHNAKDVCVKQAKGDKKTGLAALEENYENTSHNRYKTRIAKAEATYDVEKEKCDDSSGHSKSICVKQAKAAYVKSKSDANVEEAADKGNVSTKRDVSDAKKNASEENANAAYDLARERCDSLTDTEKNKCVQDLKIKYGKM